MVSIWLVTGACALALVLLYVTYMSRTHSLFRRMGVPGPAPSLVLGNFLQEVKAGLIDFHIQMYNKYRGHKVFGIYRGDVPMMVIRDLDMIRDICVKNFNNFANRTSFFDEEPMCCALTEAKDEHWKTIRKTVSPTFNSSRLRLMYRHIKSNTQKLQDFLKAKEESHEPIELKEVCSRYTMDVIASTGFGMQIDCISNEDNQFMRESKAIVESLGRIFIFKFFLFFLRPVLKILGITGVPKSSLDFFTRFIDAAIQIRKDDVDKKTPNNDFLNLMLDAEHDEASEVNDNMTEEEATVLYSSGVKQGLTKADIQGQAIIYILAGFETVASAMSFTLFLLATHPDCLQKALDEVDAVLDGQFPDYDSVHKLPYLDMCLSEAMRAYNPTFLNERVCSSDCEIQGVRIPKGLVVTFPLCAIHRDPDHWPEPDKFIPERFSPEHKTTRHPYAHMPFGYGPRQCVGMRLAQLELKVAVAAVLQRFKPVPCGKTVYPPQIEKFRMGAKDGLWVALEAR